MQERSLRNVVYLGAGLGLIVSLFAASEFFDPALRAVCSFNGFFSCGTVDASGLTSTLGIPDYVWGTGGFILILIVASIAEQRRDDRRPEVVLLGLTTLGVALSVYLLYVELAEIHALCLVCASAYLLGVVAWAGAIGLVRSPGVPGPQDDGGAGADADADATE
jgi:uncharacterized membrane protein